MEELMVMRQHVQDCIKYTQQLMAQRGRTKFILYPEGTQVWLEGVNLQILYPTSKVAPKRYGPFHIKKVLSDITYELELPPQWKIHPVFHVVLPQLSLKWLSQPSQAILSQAEPRISS